MKMNDVKTNRTGNKPGNKKEDALNGYPLYPADEDIFEKSKEEIEINPEDISKIKKSNKGKGDNNEKDFKDDLSGGDLDFSGSDMDDEENIGIEDEENDLFSLGGDDHNDLDEYKGE